MAWTVLTCVFSFVFIKRWSLSQIICRVIKQNTVARSIYITTNNLHRDVETEHCRQQSGPWGRARAVSESPWMCLEKRRGAVGRATKYSRDAISFRPLNNQNIWGRGTRCSFGLRLHSRDRQPASSLASLPAYLRRADLFVYYFLMLWYT